MSTSNDFWESLGISSADINETISKRGNRIFKQLSNKLNRLSDQYFRIIKNIFGIDGYTLTGALENLFNQSQSDFIDVFALAVFAEKRIDPDIIFDVARKNLTGELLQRISEETIDSVVILLPLFTLNKDLIREIYHNHLIQCSPMKKFYCEPRIRNPVDLKNLDSQIINNLLQSFENRRRADLRRPIKLWWIEKNEDYLKIIFRREKKGRSQVKLVEKNLFQKTGDEKIFIFRDGCNVVEVCSRREPKRTLDIAEFIVSDLAGHDVEFLPVINKYSLEKIDSFINRLKSLSIDGASLHAIKVRNVALENSPTLMLECSESVVPAIQELEEHYKLDIIVEPEDILGFRLKMDDKFYNLKTKLDGDQIELVFDNRNVRGAKKQMLSQFLDRQMGS